MITFIVSFIIWSVVFYVIEKIFFKYMRKEN